MDIFWIGKTAPPGGFNLKRAATLKDVPNDALVFVNAKDFTLDSDIVFKRVYLVSDQPTTSPFPDGVEGIIPPDARVIKAISNIYREVLESYDMADTHIDSLSEKNLAIKEARSRFSGDGRRFKDIINNSTDLIFVLGPSGKIMFCNDTMKQHLAEDNQTLIGKSFVDFIIDEDRDFWEKTIENIFLKEESSKTEVRLHLTSGKTGIFSFIGSPLVEDGRIYALSVIGRDVTDIRAMEYRLSAQPKDLALMIDGLAHALRNPLTVIGVYIRRFERQNRSKDKKEKYGPISRMVSSVTRIENMVSQIERYESIVSMNVSFSRVNLTHLVKDAVSSLDLPLLVNIKDEQDILAYTDSDHIKVAFSRILENTIDTGSLKVEVHLFKDKTYAYIAIRDFGYGVEDDPQTIFAPFYSTDPMKVGLGLTEARIAMVKIGAEIEMVPQAEPGAIFILKVLLDRRNKPRDSN